MKGMGADTILLGLGILVAAALWTLAIARWHIRGFALATVILLVLPVFFDPASRSLTLLRAFRGSVSSAGPANGAVHVGIVLIASLAAAVLLHRLTGVRPQLWAQRSMLALGVWLSGAMIVGLATGAGVLGLAFYFQTMVPLVAWYATAGAGLAPEKVSRAVVWAGVATMTFVLLIAVVRSGTLSGNYQVVSALVQAIPQFRSYFPIVPVCAVAFAVAGWKRHRTGSALTLAVTWALLPLMWSRMGLLMLVLAFGIAILARPSPDKAGKAMVAAVAVGAGGALVLRTALGGMLGARDSAGSTAEASGESRLLLAKEALSRIAASPFFGDAFTPFSNRLAGGTVVDEARLFPAHNQYLDLALRGGIVALVLMLFILGGFLRRCVQALDNEDEAVAEFHAALLAIIVAVVVGGMTHLFLVQPWSGGLLFALLGVSSSVAVGRGHGRPGAREFPIVGTRSAKGR